MNKATAIIPADPKPTALSVPELMQAIVEKGITEASVSVMEKMLTIHREMQRDEARASFNRAFAAMQRETAPIRATKAIPGSGNTIRSTFAPFEEIHEKVTPILQRHGFSLSFSQRAEPNNRTTIICTLMHADGHERSSEYTTRGVTSPGNNEAQNDGGTNKFAKRYALCNMLNIVIDHDMDARVEGDTITPAEAADVERRIRAVRKDEARVATFLKLAGADSFAAIKRAGYQVVVAMLEQAERAAAGAKSTTKPTAQGEFDDLGL